LHFVGHGGFDTQAQDGVLILEDEQGRGRRVSGQSLATVLTDHAPLRLVVLNSCEGARTARADPFAGVAQSLVQQGIPAVIAMQFEISDAASITFAHEFYAALADGYPVDAALGDARGAIFAQVNDLEWGTPVLYLRAPDGVILAPQGMQPHAALTPAVTAGPASAAVPPTPTPPAPETTSPAPTPAAATSRAARPAQPFPVRYLALGAILVAVALLIGGAYAFGLFGSAAGNIQRRGTDNAEMVYVPAGAFPMGSADNDATADNNEKPQHTVNLDAFWIDRHEVTNAQYAQCVTAGKCDAPSAANSYTRAKYYGIPQFDTYPVINVSWAQANAYCAWASKRLPTEAQWEKAARGTDGRTYPWGNQFDQSRLNSNAVKGDTTPVGAYPGGASPYNALDMAGNVFEMVNDWYAGDYYAESLLANPPGPAAGELHVMRGGGFVHDPAQVRSAARYALSLDSPADSQKIGFRCAQSA